jgi:Flp pilus assembly protein TadG
MVRHLSPFLIVMKLQKQNRTGASAMEFALVAPAIIILVLGLMEWSRFEMIRQVSSTAAFAAARVGTLPGATESDMEQHVDSVLSVYAISQATRVGTLTADEANISISVPMANNSWFIKKLFGNAVIQRDFTLKF